MKVTLTFHLPDRAYDLGPFTLAVSALLRGMLDITSWSWSYDDKPTQNLSNR